MSDPNEIWQLGRWIAQREGGAARLTWSEGELTIRIFEGRIRFIEGLDSSEISRRLGCEPADCKDLLKEARTLAKDRPVAETQTMGIAKEVLQDALRQWLIDPTRELEMVDGEPDEIDGATISITHTLVELVLSDTSGEISNAILPDLDVLLQRSKSFLDLYGPLRLSEDADFIVAKITGERTAQEVADRSPHGAEEVIRLLSALVTTGILEARVPLFETSELDLLPAEPEVETTRQHLPVWWIAAAAAAMIILLAVLGYLVTRPESVPDVAESATEWTLVIDMGCEPQDLQRVLKKAQDHPKVLRPIAADLGDGEPCWRLVWGRFSSLERAQEAVEEIPQSLRRDGFDPHPIEFSSDETSAPESLGG